MSKRIEITREQYERQIGFKPDKHSIGVCMYRRRNGKDELVCEYVFMDGSEMDDIERLGRLIDPR